MYDKGECLWDLFGFSSSLLHSFDGESIEWHERVHDPVISPCPYVSTYASYSSGKKTSWVCAKCHLVLSIDRAER
jgi:hypothetical protein